jgi:hypothetical protein
MQVLAQAWIGRPDLGTTNSQRNLSAIRRGREAVVRTIGNIDVEGGLQTTAGAASLLGNRAEAVVGAKDVKTFVPSA